jgi:hypothetical protein
MFGHGATQLTTMTAGDRRNQGKSPTLRPGFLWALPASMRRQLAKTKISEYILAWYHAMVMRENPEGRKNIVPTRLQVLTEFVGSARAPLNTLIKQAAAPRFQVLASAPVTWTKRAPASPLCISFDVEGPTARITAETASGGLYHVYRRVA